MTKPLLLNFFEKAFVSCQLVGFLFQQQKSVGQVHAHCDQTGQVLCLLLLGDYQPPELGLKSSLSLCFSPTAL